ELISEGVSWSQNRLEYPNDTETHQYEVRFKTSTEPSDGSSADYWYIQPNRGDYGADFEVEIWDFQLEKGNRATDWTPATEDHAEYTTNIINQLADEISLEYIKDDELIAGIRIGDSERIGGANVEITGDTLIRGDIGANNATFLGLTTEDMTALRATIRTATVTGTITSTNAVFQRGTFRNI